MVTPKKKAAAKAEPNETRRCYRYHADCPKGKIFTGDTAIAAAEKDGWTDSPNNIKPATKKKAARNASK